MTYNVFVGCYSTQLYLHPPSGNTVDGSTQTRDCMTLKVCWLYAEVILRATRDEELAVNHAMPHSSTVSSINSVKRLPTSSHELGILGLPPEKMALVREKKDDIEKVVCCILLLFFFYYLIYYYFFWCPPAQSLWA